MSRLKAGQTAVERAGSSEDASEGGKNQWAARKLGLVLFCVRLICAAQGTHGLRISSIQVPAAVANSSQVTLVCNYQLQGYQLYSVKWYKNYVEFYHFQPSDAPEPQWRNDFSLDGISVNLAKSNASHVHLDQVSLSSEATYKCEVSADWPSFATVAMERQMKVFVLPKQRPSILDQSQPQTNQSGLASERLAYRPNELLNLTCLSAGSRPAAQLSWLLNGQPIVEGSSSWLTWQPASAHPSEPGLWQSRLGLAFRPQPSHLLRLSTAGSGPKGQGIRLSCVARLSLDYQAETVVRLAAGKSSLKRRGQPQLPAPMSLLSPSGSPSRAWPAGAAGAQGSPDVASEEPRLARAQSRRGSFSEQGAWIRQEPLDGSSLGASRASPSPLLWTRPGNQRQASVYTSRELREQAELVERRMQASQPNELEPPNIFAQVNQDHSSPPDSGLIAQPGPAVAPSTGSASTGWPDTKKAAANNNQDYALHDKVHFTCSPRLGGSPPDRNLTKTLHSSWLLNNKEDVSAKRSNFRPINQILMDRVNSFDGANFFYLPHHLHQQSLLNQQNPKHSADTRIQTRASSQSDHLTPNSDSDIPQTGPNNALEPQTSSAQVDNDSAADITVLIEFTSSLFQLPELNLKCRTRVEQALIEYEHRLFIPIAHYNQQTDQPNHRNRASHLDPPIRNHNQNQRSRSNDVNANNKNKNHNSASSKVASSTSGSCHLPKSSWSLILICLLAFAPILY